MKLRSSFLVVFVLLISFSLLGCPAEETSNDENIDDSDAGELDADGGEEDANGDEEDADEEDGDEEDGDEEDANGGEEDTDEEQCEAPQELCAESCVDTDSNPDHCGDCDTACAGDLECSEGSCACPEGQVRCNDECVTGDTCEVIIANFAFSPEELSIDAGTKVRWTNEDGANHTATSGEAGTPDGTFDSGNLGNGDDFEFTFADAGEYPYYCTPHAGSMQASVTVE